MESADRGRRVIQMGLFKERIFSGFSLSNFTRVRDVLASNHIWYTTKVRDLSGGTGLGASRAVTGSFGIKPDSSKEYEVPVKKKDADKARHLISKITFDRN